MTDEQTNIPDKTSATKPSSLHPTSSTRPSSKKMAWYPPKIEAIVNTKTISGKIFDTGEGSTGNSTGTGFFGPS